ncbi:MAG TPA: ABC transporter permease [Rhodanobacteraceae bacterium]
MSAVLDRPWTLQDSVGVYLREARFEFLRVLRTPGFVLPTLLFPALFYVFFGLLFAKGHVDVATYMLAAYGTFGVMAPALFGFGVGVAMERERGVLAMKRVAPLPPLAYFAAKAAMAMLFALIVVLMLFVLGAAFGGVRLPAIRWVSLAVVLVLGAVPFCALGLLVGLFVNGQASAAVINLIYLPMSFLAGLWVPLQFLPHWLQGVAVWLPTYHLAEIALRVAGSDARGGIPMHVAYLVVFTAACVALAVFGWRRVRDR